MITSYNAFNQISWSDVSDWRDEIVESYGDEPHQLLLAEAEWSDSQKITEASEFLEYHSTSVTLVPTDDFEDFITDRLHSDPIISQLLQKKEAGIWPYTAIKIKMEKVIEEAKADMGVDEVELDGTEYCVFDCV